MCQDKSVRAFSHAEALVPADIVLWRTGINFEDLVAEITDTGESLHIHPLGETGNTKAPGELFDEPLVGVSNRSGGRASPLSVGAREDPSSSSASPPAPGKPPTYPRGWVCLLSLCIGFF